MSWTRIAELRQTGYQVGKRGWVAGYDKEGAWRQSEARILPAGRAWLRLGNGDVVRHPITHYSPFLAPPPPPKPLTLLGAAKRALDCVNIWYQLGSDNTHVLAVREELREAIACEEGA